MSSLPHIRWNMTNTAGLSWRHKSSLHSRRGPQAPWPHNKSLGVSHKGNGDIYGEEAPWGSPHKDRSSPAGSRGQCGRLPQTNPNI